MSYRIGSFNVHNLAFGGGRDLDVIAKIIMDNQMDIVALQEVLSEGKILDGLGGKKTSGQAKAYEYSLLSRLSGNWRASWLSTKTRAKDYPYLGKDNRGEGFAFLWNTDRFELPKDSEGEEIFPKPYGSNYKVHKDDGEIRLIRTPGYGRFKVKSCKAELRLMTVHIVYGKPKAENLNVDLDFGAVSMRRNEFRIIAGEIYPRISEYYKEINCTSPYTLILGDYNLNLESSGMGKTLLEDVVYFDERGRKVFSWQSGNRIIYSTQSELTTINMPGTGYASNYDHFSYDDRVKDNIVKSITRINAVEDYYSGVDDKYSKYKEKVSDHLPIMIEIDFK